LKTFSDSYHGLAGQYGVTTVANCASCHGAHDILPSDDPDSSVHKDNLAKTCGQCHPNAGSQLAKGSVHLSPSIEEDRAVYIVTVLYIALIILVIGSMLIHNFLDFIPKIREYYRRHKEEGRYLRFTRNERMQHLVLGISFIFLAYTGFALRHPNAWWALPFQVLSIGFDLRGLIHRAMAVVFCGLSLYHLWWLFRTRRGRGQLISLLPRMRDLTELIHMTKYNLGLLKHKPKHARYNYIEKMEYWALVWGTLIMIVTGGLLIFENFTMQYFPKWVLDVAVTIHYYESVLATLAIIIWHFYFTIFDLSQYPLNLSMLTGRIPHHERRESASPRKKPENNKAEEG